MHADEKHEAETAPNAPVQDSSIQAAYDSSAEATERSSGISSTSDAELPELSLSNWR